MRLFL